MKRRYNVFLVACCVLCAVGVQFVRAQDGPLAWTQNLNNGARVYAMVVDPANQATLYSAGLDSGVYKSTNSGVSWFAANNGLTYRAVQALAISMSNPGVLYAGTDQNGSTNSGVYVSTDGGGTWVLSNNGITDVKAIQALAIDPTNPSIAYAATFDGVNASTVGIFKTIDRGSTWVADSAGLTNKNILSLAINPVNPSVMYAGSSLVLPGSTGPSKMFKSTNAGAGWFEISNGLPTGTTTGDPIRALSISTVNPEIVLAALFMNDTSGGAYLTTNGGANWAKMHNGIPNLTGVLIRSCLIRPGSSTEFFVGLDSRGVYHTIDGGVSWTDFSGGPLTNTFTIRSLVFRTQADSTLYAGAATTSPTTARGVFEYSWPTTIFPAYYNYNNVGASNNSFPFSVLAGKEVQWLFLPNDFNQPTPCPTGQQITKLYFFMLGTATATFTNLTIKLGQADIATLPTGVIYTGPMDTVYNRSPVSLASTATSWMVMTLDRPFVYDPTKGLIVDIAQCGATAIGMTLRQNTFVSPPFRRTYINNAGSCVYVYGGQDGNIVNCGVDVEPAPPSARNSALLLPTPGVNTNYVQVPHQPSMVGFGNTITIEAWVRPGGSTTANTVLNHGAASFDYQLGINATTIFPFFRAGGTVVIDSFANLSVATWAHLAVTYDGTTLKFYKDGVMHLSRLAALTLGTSANEMRIGRGNADAGSGNIDELRLWSVARTQGQIDSTKCLKYPGQFASTVGLKAVWHFDSTYVDSVSNYNGTPIGVVDFQTADLPCGPVGVTEEKPDIPSDYQLAQNYPNPFNPTTTLLYGLPRAAHVTMKIYNVLGQEVVTLRDEVQGAGMQTVIWDGRNALGTRVASGVYFYRIEAKPVDHSAPFVSIKKMLMLK